MLTVTYRAEGATPAQMRDEIVADLRRTAAQHIERANATKRVRSAEAHTIQAAALIERAEFWEKVIVTD